MRRPNNETITAYALGAVGAAEGVFKYYIRPELTGKRAWATVGALVAAYELTCPEGQLLSEECDRAIDKHPNLTRAAIGYTALHLMNMLPEKFDLYHQAHKRLKRK